MLAFQMRIVNKGTYKGGALMRATNPYTGYGYYRWEGKGTLWGKTFTHRNENESEEEVVDECAPMSKGEYDDWCNGIGYGR